MSAIQSRLGKPDFGLTFPSWAKPKKVSKNSSAFSAGLNSTIATPSSSPAFHHACGVSVGTVAPSPGPTHFSSPLMTKAHVPAWISKVSSTSGWTWAAATKPRGLTRASIREYSPPVSCPVFRKVNLSPVTGCSLTSPLFAIALSSASWWFRGRSASAGRGRGLRLEDALQGPQVAFDALLVQAREDRTHQAEQQHAARVAFQGVGEDRKSVV